MLSVSGVHPVGTVSDALKCAPHVRTFKLTFSSISLTCSSHSRTLATCVHHLAAYARHIELARAVMVVVATQSAGDRDLYISLLGSQCLACGRDGDGGGGKGRDAKNMQIHFAKREYSFAFACRCVCVCVRQSHCICRLWITAGTHFLSHHYFVRFVVGGGGDGGTLLATHRNRHTIYVRHVQQIALLYIMRYVLHALDRRTYNIQ